MHGRVLIYIDVFQITECSHDTGKGMAEACTRDIHSARECHTVYDCTLLG